MRSRQKQNSDHAHKHNTPTIDNEVISQQLKALLTPAIFAQEKYYKQLAGRICTVIDLVTRLPMSSTLCYYLLT
jgi:hypothetical protein